MSKDDHLKKTRVMGLRLSERLYELLTQKSEEFNMSKSEILRLSFEIFRLTTGLIKDYHVIIVAEELLTSLFEMASVEKLEEAAYINAKIVINESKILCFEMGLKFNLENFMKIGKKLMSRDTLGFFTKLNFRTDSNKHVHLIGLHEINEPFSQYLISTFKHIMKTFNYIAIEQTIGEKSIEIEFRRV